MDHQQVWSKTLHGDTQALTEARLMLSAFMSIGVNVFGVTRKNTRGKIVGYEEVPADILLKGGRSLVFDAESKCQSVIIRPFFRCETSRTVVQIDDVDLLRAKRLARLSFCITETSPANFQAFLCISDGAEEYATLRVQLTAAMSADKGATCAGRLAGTLNTKQARRRADGTYPRVRLAHVASGSIVNIDELRASGLLAVSMSEPPRGSFKTETDRDNSHLRLRRRPGGASPKPSYDKALASVQIKEDGKPDRSAADLLFAITCLRWCPPLSHEEIAALLMDRSEKAWERKDAESYVATTIAEAIRRA